MLPDEHKERYIYYKEIQNLGFRIRNLPSKTGSRRSVSGQKMGAWMGLPIGAVGDAFCALFCPCFCPFFWRWFRLFFCMIAGCFFSLKVVSLLSDFDVLFALSASVGCAVSFCLGKGLTCSFRTTPKPSCCRVWVFFFAIRFYVFAKVCFPDSSRFSCPSNRQSDKTINLH